MGRIIVRDSVLSASLRLDSLDVNYHWKYSVHIGHLKHNAAPISFIHERKFE